MSARALLTIRVCQTGCRAGGRGAGMGGGWSVGDEEMASSDLGKAGRERRLGAMH